MAESTTLDAKNNNKYGIYGFSSSYSIAHSTCYGVHVGLHINVGQVVYRSYYTIHRGTPMFDLSSLSGYEVTNATLKLTGDGDYSDTDFNMQARAFTESTLAENDASFTGYGDTSFGSINSSNYSETADSMQIEFNSSGLSYLTNNVGNDECVIMLVSDRDVSETEPDGDEFIGLCSPEYSTVSKRPHLYVEYSEPSTWTPKIIMMCPILLASSLQYILSPLKSTMFKGVI